MKRKISKNRLWRRRSFLAKLGLGAGGLIAAFDYGSGPLLAAARDEAKEAASTIQLAALADWRTPTSDWLLARNVALDPADSKKFFLETAGAEPQPGAILANGRAGRTQNILSKAEHGDAEVHVEFVVPQGSNSGVYLQARYEVQILDSWGVKEPKYSDCGGIYERWKDDHGYEGHAPRVNASRRPGEWQIFDITFRAPRFDEAGRKIENARFIRVLHNGQLVHENVEVTGPTRAATFENDEKPLGPLMLQGDHGPVAFRNIRIRPLQLK